MTMRDNDKLRRSNLVLFGLVFLVLLYGVITRLMSGDTSLYIFGIPINLPFGQTQDAPENTEEDASGQSGNRELLLSIDELLS